MAAHIATDFKALLTIKQKSRLDTICDQYNRIFMVRMMLVCTTVMAISWYTDDMNCIVPKSNGVSENFVSAACWIQGLYVYNNMMYNVDRVAFFAMPRNMDHEGMIQHTSELCMIRSKIGQLSSPDCKPMVKTFFLQYQYMPFFLGALSVLYYVPYVGFRLINKDKQQLKDAMKKTEKNAEDFISRHFESGISNIMTIRVIANVFVKILYIFSNAFTLMWLNDILGGNFLGYGTRFVIWTRLKNTIQYDYMGMRSFPKPGNMLLPPFGYCEINESARDIKNTLANKHKFVCELSQHILYQYCLLVLWFAIIVGIIVSIAGVIILLYVYVKLKLKCRHEFKEFKLFHLRKLEYLEYMRIKDIEFYKECKHLLCTKSGAEVDKPLMTIKPLMKS